MSTGRENISHDADREHARLVANSKRIFRAWQGLDGFDWAPGWRPGPLNETPASVFPPYLEERDAPDTPMDHAAALVDALHGLDLGFVDADVISALARYCDTPVVAGLVSLIHRARLAGPIPGRARPGHRPR
ncbi:hypothetical protein [Pseudonocardia spinosispora]|uniref:hypothetical protein n=1 Tax=Pseudonocardia spinosispora TaxID=103441 RepID=UPI000405988C|nr:hypothetical protein [Pseudonocardia spinosispora]